MQHLDVVHAPVDVDMPDVLAQVFVMEKGTKRFLKNGGGW